MVDDSKKQAIQQLLQRLQGNTHTKDKPSNAVEFNTELINPKLDSSETKEETEISEGETKRKAVKIGASPFANLYSKEISTSNLEPMDEAIISLNLYSANYKQLISDCTDLKLMRTQQYSVHGANIKAHSTHGRDGFIAKLSKKDIVEKSETTKDLTGPKRRGLFG